MQTHKLHSFGFIVPHLALGKSKDAVIANVRISRKVKLFQFEGDLDGVTHLPIQGFLVVKGRLEDAKCGSAGVDQGRDARRGDACEAINEELLDGNHFLLEVVHAVVSQLLCVRDVQEC